jgi:hypothetical protein
MSKKTAVVLIAQNPKYAAFEADLDAIQNEMEDYKEKAVAEAKLKSEENWKRHQDKFKEVEAELAKDGLLVEGYDGEKGWSIGFGDGAVVIGEPEEKKESAFESFKKMMDKVELG